MAAISVNAHRWSVYISYGGPAGGFRLDTTKMDDWVRLGVIKHPVG